MSDNPHRVTGYGSFFIACHNNEMGPIRRYVSDQGDDINADSDGDTGLHQAAYNGHVEVCRFLVENGADTGKRNSRGKTALDLARKQGHGAVVALLEAPPHPQAVAPAAASGGGSGGGARSVINSPGRWDAMISYTQRNAVSEALAHMLRAELIERGKTVWLDVKMNRRDEAAMKEGVKHSRCVIAIVSGPPGEESAYFRRSFCLSELRWANEAGVRVVPIVAAEDKGKITEFFVDVPADLEHVKSLNWEHIDRKDNDYFELGVTKICKAAGLGEQ